MTDFIYVSCPCGAPPPHCHCGASPVAHIHDEQLEQLEQLEGEDNDD